MTSERGVASERIFFVSDSSTKNTHIGALGFFATHYHSLAAEFENHPEIAPKRMAIHGRLVCSHCWAAFSAHSITLLGIPHMDAQCIPKLPLRESVTEEDSNTGDVSDRGLDVLMKAIEAL
jgi:DNA mismatch repair protein MSH6